MIKARFIRAVGQRLTSIEGGDLDVIAAERAKAELEKLPDWVFSLHQIEKVINARVDTERRITGQIIERLKKTKTVSSQLERLNAKDAQGLAQHIENAISDANNLSAVRLPGRQRKMGPTQTAIAMWGALARAGISATHAVGGLRRTLPLLGLSAPEIETALKKARTTLHVHGIKRPKKTPD